MSENYDWNDRMVQIATVEYAWREIGGPPDKRSGAAARSEWDRAAEGLSVAMKVPGGRRVLESWMRDEKNRPECTRGSGPARDDDDETIIAREAAPSDLLEGLLKEEDDTLSEGERLELALALECGSEMCQAQRNALAVLLRGSAYATRAEILFAVVAFLVPEEDGLGRRRLWKATRSSAVVPEGGSYDHEKTSVTIAGHPVIGSSVLVIKDAEGKVVKARIFARANLFRNGAVEYSHLLPSETFFSPLTSRRLAIMESLMHPTRSSEGKRMAKLFGVSEPAVHYQRKGIVEKVKAVTGSHVGFSGLRNVDQKNKGVARGPRKGAA